MSRFQKDKEKLGFRTPEHFREKTSVPKIPLKVQRVRFTQHKG